MSESLHGSHKVGVGHLTEWEGKKRLKPWGDIKNAVWRYRVCLSDCEVCCRRVLFPRLMEWLRMETGMCVMTKRQTTQTESDNKKCWLERHTGRLYLILWFIPLKSSEDFSGQMLGFYKRYCTICSSRDITDMCTYGKIWIQDETGIRFH